MIWLRAVCTTGQDRGQDAGGEVQQKVSEIDNQQRQELQIWMNIWQQLAKNEVQLQKQRPISFTVLD